MDFLNLNKQGFQNQMMSVMTPEQKARLEQEMMAKAAAQNKNVVLEPGPGAVDPTAMMQQPGLISMVDPQAQAMTQDMRSLYKRLVPETQQGVEEGRQILADIKKMNTGFDFSPMAALADKFSGGGNQLSSAAQSIKGLTEADKAKLALLAQGQVQDDNKALLSEIGTQLRANDNMRALDSQMKNSRLAQNQQFQLETQYDKRVQTDLKPLFEAAPSMQSAEQLLTPDESGKIKVSNFYQVLSNASRQLGEKGVLTDQDIARVQLPTINSYLAKYEVLAGNPNATIDAAEVAPLLDAIRIGQQALQDITNDRFDKTTQAFTVRGLRPEISRGYKETYGAKPKPAAPAPAPKPSIIKSLLEE